MEGTRSSEELIEQIFFEMLEKIRIERPDDSELYNSVKMLVESGDISTPKKVIETLMSLEAPENRR